MTGPTGVVPSGHPVVPITRADNTEITRILSVATVDLADFFVSVRQSLLRVCS